MATFTIELPDELARQVEDRGISQQRLEKMVLHLVQAYLREWDVSPADQAAPSKTGDFNWGDGETFARRVIANNRELFEELAQL